MARICGCITAAAIAIRASKEEPEIHHPTELTTPTREEWWHDGQMIKCKAVRNHNGEVITVCYYIE